MLTLANLEAETRTHMLAEVRYDLSRERLYLSDRLTPTAQAEYPKVLQEAVVSHNDDWLAAQLRRLGLREMEQYTRSGKVMERKVPVNAAEMLAEGEFNRFYLRGLCLKALENGHKKVVIYRAKLVSQPRPESEQRIGQHVDAATLLRDLREHVGVDTALGLPPGPNSGLSAKLPSQIEQVVTVGE